MAARRKRRPALCAGLATIMLYPPHVLADGADLPAGGQVTAGAASITSTAGQMLVNQSSSRAVIDWSSFNIGQQSDVTFDMPGTSAAVLNRVTGATPSTIAGNLTANGQVFLVNPNGIAITGSGAVKVGGGFTASTLDLRNDDFLQGRLAFSGTSPASITHAGRIEGGEGGFAALIARGGIENSGLITVPAGRVALGTGSAITLDPTGTGFMQILAPLPDGDGGTIRSSGRIIAESGRVEIKAASAAKAIRDIVNVSGEVSVASVRKQGGTIILDGGSSGLRLSAKLNASSRQAKGGNVAVGGKRIALEASAIDVQGTSGGVVSIGGGRQGATVPGSTTASSVSIDSTSTIDASARAESGGEITVWSDDDTRFRGNIVATGVSGDGGAAEVSSLGAYEFAGRVNLLSAEGRAGQLLLDPYDVVISTGADANQSGFTATGTGAVINTASLEAALAGASVTVLTGSSGSETGTITVQSPISWSANTTLTLDAAGNIVLNGAITASGATSGITLTAAGAGGVSGAGDIASSGTLTFNVNNAAAAGTFAGVISGTGQLVKGGPGLITLAGANSYTGTTTINAGTLRAGSSTALGVTSSSTISGTFDMAGYAADIGGVAGMGLITNSGGAATLSLGRSAVSRAFGGTIEDGAGSISIVKIGGAAQTLDGPNRFTGSITVNLATLQIRNGAGLNNGNYAGDITIGPAGTFRYSSSANQTLSGALSGAGTFTKDASASVITLSNASGFTGPLNIIAGTLRAGSANGFGSAIVSVGSSTTLDLAGFSTALGSLSGAGTITNSGSAATLSTGGLNTSTTFSGILQNGAGTLSLTKTGTGTLTLSGANTYTGQTTISAGTIALSGSGVIVSDIDVGASGTLSFSRTPFTYAGVLSGTGYLNFSNGMTFTGNNTFTGSGAVCTGCTINVGNGGTSGTFNGNVFFYAGTSLIFNRSDTSTFTASITGNATIIKNGAGTLIVTGSIATPTATINAGTLQIGNGGTTGSISNTITNNSALVFNRSDALTYAGAISGTGSLTKLGAGTLTLSGTNTHTGGTTISAGTLQIGAGSTTGSITGNILNNSTLTFSRSDALTYGDVISGTGSLTKLGTGTLTLTGESTYSGGTTISGGTLQLGNGGTAGMVPGNIVNNGVLAFNRSDALTYGNVVSGTGSLTQAGTGTLTLTGNNTYTGATTINAARSLQIGNGGTTGVVTGNITNNGTLAFNRSNALTYAGVISGTGSFTQSGTGTLTLSMPHTYTGVTTVDPGSTLQFGIGGTTGSVAGSIVNNGLVILNHSVNYTYSTPISGSGALNKIGPNTLIFGDLAYTGATTISAGTLQLGSGGTTGSVAGDIVNNSTLVFNRSDAVAYGGVISGTGSFTKLGAGTLTLSGTNLHTGPTTVSAGTLKAGSATAFGSNAALTVSSGAIADLGGFSISIGSLSGGGTVTNSGAAATLTAGGLNTGTTFSGVMQDGAGTLSLVKTGTGTLTLSGANIHTGTITVSAGTLLVGAGGTTGSVAGNIVNNALLSFNRSDALTYGGVISGTGSLTQVGPGTLTLTGESTYSGGTTISGGTLQLGNGGTAGMVPGNIVNNGVLAFNRSDALTYGNVVSGTGSLTQAGTGTLTLTGNNTYTGATTINAARSLQIGNGGTTGVVTGNITNNGTLAFNRSNALTYAGVISGTGSFTQSGTGTLTLSMPHTYTGVTTVDPGSTLQFGIGGTTGSVAGSIVNNGLVVLNHSVNYTYSTPISGSGALNKIGPNTLIFGDLAYTGATTISAGTLQLGSGGTTGSVAGDIVNNSTLVFNRSDALTYGGVISGTGSFTQVGPGTLTLTGESTYTGGTTISGGTLQLGNGGTAGMVPGNIVNNSVLAFNRSDALTYGNVVSGTGSLRQAGTGTLTLTGNNTYTGATTLSSGTLKAGSAAAFGSNSALAVSSGAIADLGGFSISIGSLSGGGTFTNSGAAATLTVGALNTSTTFSGVLRDGAGLLSLTKTGTGTLTLSGANTHTGTTTVSAGTLNVNGDFAGNIVNNAGLSFGGGSATFAGSMSGLGSFNIQKSGPLTLTNDNAIAEGTILYAVSSDVVVGNGGTSGNFSGTLRPMYGGTLTFDRSDSFTFGGSLWGATNTVIKNGPGTMTLTGLLSSGIANSTHSTVINAGTLQIGDGGTTGSILGTITNNAALVFNRSNALDQSGAISGTGSLTQAGSGTLTLSGANTYTGATTVSAGTLKAGSATAFGSNSALAVGSGAIADLGGFSASIGSLSGSGTVTNSGAAATLTSGGLNTSTTFSGVLQNGTGALSLVKTGTGTFTLAGANTHTGGTTISAGTLQLGNGGTAGMVPGNIVNNSALVFNRSDAVSHGSVISGTGSLTKLGPGTLILTGTNTYTGGTTISEGSLQLGNGGTTGSIAGSISNSGTLIFNRSDDLTEARSLSGAIVKMGTGTMTYTASSGTPNFTISEGTLQFGDGSTVCCITPGFVNNAALIFNHSNGYQYNGTISGTGSFTKAGAGTLLLTGANSYTGTTTIAGGMLMVFSPGAATGLSQSAGITVNGTLDLGGNSTSIASLAGSGTVTNNGTAAALTAGGNGASTTFSGVLQNGTGVLSFIKTGTGTLTLTGTNTHTGGTTVSAGTLQLGSGGTTGSVASDIVNNGALTFSRSDALTYGGVISGTGPVTKLGAGTLTLTGTNTYTGGTTVSAGTLQLGNGGTSGSITGNITNNGTLVVNRSDTLTYGGVVSGTGSLATLGAGTLILTGASTYTGATTVNAGSTLQFGAGGAALGSIAGSITNNGTVIVDTTTSGNFYTIMTGAGSFIKRGTATVYAMNNHQYTGDMTVERGMLWFVDGLPRGNMIIGSTGQVDAQLSSSMTYNGIISGSGTLGKRGAGTLTLTANSPFTGAILVLGGNVQIGNGGTSGNIAGPIVFQSGNSLTFDRSDDFAFAGTVTGGSLVKNGAGTMVATGALSPTSTTISGGTLQIGDGGTSGSLSGSAANNAALAFNRSDALTFGGIVSGSGSLTKLGLGTLTVTGANSYTGATTVTSGTLMAGSANAFGSNSALTVSSGATADLGGFSTTIGSLSGGGTVTNSGAAAALTEGGLNATTTFSGVLQNGTGTLSLVKTGTGTLILTGASTYTGGTTVNAGSILQMGNGGATGIVSGNIANSGSVVLNTSYNGWVNGFTIGGTGSFTKLGPGGVLMSRNHTYTGDTIVRAGDLWFVNVLPKGDLNVEAGAFNFQPGTGSFTYAGTVTGGGAIRSYTNGTLTFTADSPFTGSLQAVSGNIQFGNGGTSGNMAGSVSLTTGASLTFDRSDDFTYSGSMGGGSLVKNGSGSLIATGSLSTSGTIINAGTLQIGNGGTSGSLAGSITNNAALVFNRSGAVNQAGSISGAGSLTQAGSGALTLSGANTYTGATGVIAGTLKAGSATAFGSNSALTVSSGAVTDLNGFSTSIGSLSGGGTVTNSGAAATLTTGGNNTSTTFSGILQNGAGVLSLVKTGTGTLTLSGDNTHTGLTLINAGSLALAGSWNAGATAALQIASSASIFGSGTLTAGTLSIGGEGSATLTGPNMIGTLASSSAVGSLLLNNAQSLTLASVQARGAVSVMVSGEASDLTIGPGAVVSSDAAGDAVSLSAARYFINTSGAGAVSTPNGRWLVYLPTPAGSNFNGLNSGNAAIWNTSSGAAVAGQGRRYVFAERPTLAITSVDLAKTYGDDLTSHIAAAYRITGFDPGLAGAYLADSEATSLSGAPAVLSAGAGSAAPAGTYQIEVAQGSLTSLTGYELAFSSAGLLTVNRAALTIRARDAVKTYDGLAYSGGTGVTYEGFVNGETEAVLSGSLAYGGTAQGAVNAGTYGLTVSGLTSGNYDISYADGLLTVSRAGLTVQARDAVKTYDGLAYSGGNGVSYDGFVNGETEAVLSGSLAYGGTAQGAVNAGTYGLTVSGLTSGNYDISYADGLLTVSRAGLTVQARDAVKTYDGLAYSGGNGVSYDGFVNGETEAVLSGSLAYGGTAQGAVNAGTYGLTVSGLTSGNYDVSFLPGLLVIEPAASPEPQPWVEPVGVVRIDSGWMGLVTRNACCLDLPRMRYAQEWLPGTDIIAPWLFQPIQEMTERY